MARFGITDGPSKWDLVIKHFAEQSRDRRALPFVISDPLCVLSKGGCSNSAYSLSLLINGLERADVSGDDWHFKGVYPLASGPVPVNGYFSTKSREGWVEWDQPKS